MLEPMSTNKKKPPARRAVGRPSSREIILDAAEKVVLEGGAPALTLDSAAKKAGVSKGGVLYHFPTKDSLLQGMVERLIRRTVESHQAASGGRTEPEQVLKGYVTNSVCDPAGIDRVAGALLVAVANDEKLLEPVRVFFRERLPVLTGGLAFERASVVHLATEGLWLMEILGISPFSPTQRRKVVAELLRQAGEA
jgi:AcrR family transcriptional regulator